MPCVPDARAPEIDKIEEDVYDELLLKESQQQCIVK
jgi:hypothetical protein